MYKVIDLFCGCGGISWGFKKKGFSIVAGVDICEPALESYAKNFPGAKALRLDISKTSPEDFMHMMGMDPGSIDVLAGGPPCQGFSKNTPASWRFLKDPRNQLYKAFLSYVEFIQPKVVIIENVAELYNAYNGVIREEILNVLREHGYSVNVQVVDMSDYGVPQKRRRCLFFGSRNGMPSFPLKSERRVSAWDAISDLPVVNQGEGFDGMPYVSEPSNDYQKHMRLCSSCVNNHVARVMKPKQTARIAALKPGQALKDLPADLKVKCGYSGAYGRLGCKMISPTITRWVFHIGSGRFAHPEEVRGLTMREAARLQSFSDDFYFCGTIIQQAGQIGNAVPPFFVEQLASEVISCLSGQDLQYK